MTTPQPVHRLIYISSATGSIAQAELDRILATSRVNNSARGLTGILLFHDGCFFQVLEGDREIVQRAFKTISADTRHGGVILLESRAVSHRSFPHWSMGYVGAHTLHPDQRQWLVDLSARVCADAPAALSTETGVNVHIESFLSSFREFA